MGLIRVSEKQEQIALRKWCDLSRITLVHIANEGKRTDIEKFGLCAQGMRPGFPDNIIMFNSKIMFIELKQNRMYSPSEMRTKTWLSQQFWIDHLSDMGFKATRCYGCDDAIKYIKANLK